MERGIFTTISMQMWQINEGFVGFIFWVSDLSESSVIYIYIYYKQEVNSTVLDGIFYDGYISIYDSSKEGNMRGRGLFTAL